MEPLNCTPSTRELHDTMDEAISTAGSSVRSRRPGNRTSLRAPLRRFTANVVGILAAILIPVCLVGCTEEVKPVQKLVEDLGSEEKSDRYKASKELSKMGAESSKLGSQAAIATEALAKTLADNDRDVRYYSAKALAKLGPNAVKAVDALAAALADADPDIRYYVVKALDNLESDAAPAVAALTTALGDENEQVRYRAAKALGNIGPEAREAVPALKQVLKDDSSDTVREAATAAMKRISRFKKG